MSSNYSDIIEVFLKKELNIPLTEYETMCFNNVDDETKKTIFELIDSCSFLEELVKVVNKMKEKSINLSVEEQQTINEKCDLKIKKMKQQEINIRKI